MRERKEPLRLLIILLVKKPPLALKRRIADEWLRISIDASLQCCLFRVIIWIEPSGCKITHVGVQAVESFPSYPVRPVKIATSSQSF